jgi:hypothetical protein
MSRLSLQVFYLWSNLEILIAPLHRSSPFIRGLRCPAIQTEHGPYITKRTQKAVYTVLWYVYGQNWDAIALRFWSSCSLDVSSVHAVSTWYIANNVPGTYSTKISRNRKFILELLDKRLNRIYAVLYSIHFLTKPTKVGPLGPLSHRYSTGKNR